jgi:hypothetical protein
MKRRISVLLSVLAPVIGILACSTSASPLATATPVPTETPIPTTTPTPIILFEERDFKPSNCFAANSTDEVKYFTEEDAFHIELLAPDWHALAPCMDADVLFTDFAAEVDVMQVDGADQSLYGLMLRMFGYDLDFYLFGISGNGMYTLIYDRLDKDVPAVRIIDWKPSTAIKRGQATNHLKAVLVGNTIELYANDTLLETIQDERISAGSVGFVVSSSSEGGVHISFDNLVVTKP